MVLNYRTTPEIYRYKQDAYIKVYYNNQYQLFTTLVDTDNQFIERHVIGPDGRFVTNAAYEVEIERLQGKEVTFQINKDLKEVEPFKTYTKDPYFRGWF